MSELEALIFDVDGTLADTERDGHRVAFNAAFADAGLDWHWSVPLYGQLLSVTGGKERIAEYLRVHQPDFRCTEPLDEFIKACIDARPNILSELWAPEISHCVAAF